MKIIKNHENKNKNHEKNHENHENKNKNHEKNHENHEKKHEKHENHEKKMKIMKIKITKKYIFFRKM